MIESGKTPELNPPSLALSLVPLGFLVVVLIINVILFKDDASYGPNQLALLLSGMLTLALGSILLKVPYKKMEERIIHSISLASQACLILLVVGSLISVWILSGIVPTMIYYGLKIINPDYFLPVACISCALVAISTGSSWSTSGTVGVALVGIGQTLGVPMGMTAGAIISGAYFGDKMSPLSDTTNLAPAMAGTDLFTHIRHMVYTSGPSILIAIFLFFIIGLSYGGGQSDPVKIKVVLNLVVTQFNIGLHLLMVPAIVLIMVARKMPAFPAMVIGVLLGVLAALIFQQPLLHKLAGESSNLAAVYSEIVSVAHGGFSFESGNTAMDKLFNRGGMSGMLTTVWLILMAMVFGGALEATGMLQKIAQSILSLVSGTASLIGSVVGTCLVMNMTASDQYLAIVVPGRMFRKSFDDFDLHPKNLSRALEDSGTVTSVLVPWNSGGAYHSKVFGVNTLEYLPFCFFNLLSPVISVFLASMNWTIEKKVREANAV